MTNTRSRSVERLIHADAQTIFDLIADPSRHRDLDGSGMVQGRPHGPARLSLGTRFTMAQKLGPIPYRSANEVVEFEEPRRIAWGTWSEVGGRRLAGGQIWRYELIPVEGGTLVRESHDLSGAGVVASIVERTGTSGRYEAAMKRTLERLAALVEE